MLSKLQKILDRMSRYKVVNDEFENRKSNDVGLHIGFIDLEALYNKDMSTDNGIRLNDSVEYTKNLDKPEIMYDTNTIFNYRFGIPKNSDTNKYLYKCPCGATYGHDKKGDICDRCGGEVTRLKFNIDFRGWITTPVDCKILNPGIFARMLQLVPIVDYRDAHIKPALKRKKKEEGVIPKVVNMSIEELKKYALAIDKNGDIIIIDPEFSKITYMELISDYILFEKFLRKYATSKENHSMIDLIFKKPSSILTYAIPVVSAKFRPISLAVGPGGVSTISSGSLGNDGLNCMLMHVSGIAHALKIEYRRQSSKTSLSSKLSRLQLKMHDILLHTIDDLGQGKNSRIRGQIFGRRYAESARFILEPLIGSKIDDAIIPIDAFRCLYTDRLINWLKVNRKHLKLTKIYKMCDPNHTLSDSERADIHMMFKDYKDNTGAFYIHINRPPTIYYSSILALRLLDIDDHKRVLQVSPFVAQLMAADHDGDAESVQSINGPHAEEIFESLKPQNHIVTWKGNYNTKLGPADVMYPLLFKATEHVRGISIIKKEI